MKRLLEQSSSVVNEFGGKLKKPILSLLLALLATSFPSVAHALNSDLTLPMVTNSIDVTHVLINKAMNSDESNLPSPGIYRDSLNNPEVLSYPSVESGSNTLVAEISGISAVKLVWFEAPSSFVSLNIDEFPISELETSQHQVTLDFEGYSDIVVAQLFIADDSSIGEIPSSPITPAFAVATYSAVSLSGPLLLGDGSDYPNKSYFKYDAFISSKVVPIPRICDLFGAPGDSFNGNDRGFDPYASQTKSKVWLEVAINWQTQRLSYNRFVGLTEIVTYDPVANKVTVYSTAQAPITDIHVHSDWSISSDTADFSFDISSANPACFGSLPIYVNATVEILRTGSAYIFGQYRTVPNHEAYFRDDLNVSWKMLFQSPINTTAGFDCFNVLVSIVTPSCGGSISASAHF